MTEKTTAAPRPAPLPAARRRRRRQHNPPVHVEASEADLDDLRRASRPRAGPSETVKDRSQGVQLATIQELARYWAEDYDWRTAEARLNALPQFIDRDRRAGHPLHSRPLGT